MKQLRKYLFTLLLGSVTATFHGIYVLYPYFAAGRHGLAETMMLMMFDYPIAWAYDAVVGFDTFKLGRIGFIVIFGIGGTMMYLAVGAAIGYVIDRIRVRWNRPG